MDEGVIKALIIGSILCFSMVRAIYIYILKKPPDLNIKRKDLSVQYFVGYL